MSASSAVASIMGQIASQLPVVLVLLLGLVFVLMNYSRLPTAALAAGAGLCILLLLVVARPVIFSVVGRAFSGEHIRLVFGLVGFLFNLIEAAALGALIYAVFADRPQATPGKPLI